MNLLLTLIPVLAPVIIATAIGFIWARSGADYPSDFIGRLVMNIGTPCLIVSVMAKTDVALGSIARVALASALVLLLMGLLGLLVVRLMKLDLATYLPPVFLPNNGNMGLPVCLFAFGEHGLALALGFFLVMVLTTFTLGITIVSYKNTLRATLLGLAKQPMLWGMAVAVGLLVTDTALPKWLANTVDLLGGFAIPLMLITLGVSLGRLTPKRWSKSLFFSALRIGGGLLVGWLVTDLLAMSGAERGVILVQASMPVAVFTYLLALRYERDHQEVATLVVVSTVMAFITLPLILAWVV